jgi:hypothetical protein
MVIACWSPKGGSGTSVFSAALGLVLASKEPGNQVLVADLGGDIPAVLGLPDASGPGLAEWLGAGDDVPAEALGRLEVEAGEGVRLLPAGPPPAPATIEASPPERGAALVSALSGDERTVVVDCGLARSGAGLAVAAEADTSLLVLRPCYLALRRALAAPLRPSGIVLVHDDARALGPGDVEDVVQAPVLATLPVQPAIARAIDAGLLGRRVPRSLSAAIRKVARALVLPSEARETVRSAG